MFVKAQEVNLGSIVGVNDPAGGWFTGLDGYIKRVVDERWVSCAESIDQPTVFRENVSITVQQKILPSLGDAQ